MVDFFYIFISLSIFFLISLDKKIFFSLAGIIYIYFAFMGILQTIAYGEISIFSYYLLIMFAIPPLLLVYKYNFFFVNKHTGSKLLKDRLSYVKILLIITTITGLLANFYLIKFAQNFSEHIITGFGYSRFYSDARYTTGEGIPVLVRALNAVTHAGAMITIIFFIEGILVKQKFYLKFLLPSLLLVTESIILGTKSIVILVMIYLISGLIVSINYHGIKKIPRKLFLSVMIIIILLLTGVVTVHYIRAQGNLTIIDIISKIVTSYFSIPFFALQHWMNDNISLLPTHFGEQTLKGIMSLIGKRHEGGEFFYTTINGIGYQTNVYTAYRNIFEDFGLILSPFIFICIMFLSIFSQRKIHEKKIKYIPFSLLISNFLLFSFATSIYIFLTNIIAILIVFSFFYIQKNHFRV